jgi:pyrimidine deaminase RibD-like protein
VGCVILDRAGQIVGEGWHGYDLLDHAKIVAIARELNLPVRYVGVGEKMTDLLEFSPEEFVDSLLE